MIQMVLVLNSGTIQLYAELDLKLARLSTIISLYVAKFMKHNKSNAAFLHENKGEKKLSVEHTL